MDLVVRLRLEERLEQLLALLLWLVLLLLLLVLERRVDCCEGRCGPYRGTLLSPAGVVTWAS